MRTFLLALGMLVSATPLIAGESSPGRFFSAHCVGCHSGIEPSGGIRLDRPAAELADEPGLLEKVLTVLEQSEMPPADEPQPAQNVVAAAVRSIRQRMAADPPRSVLKRLTRFEYTNGINDLFDADFDLTEVLPPDHVRQGFDKFGEAHVMSPHQVRAYLTTARYVADRLLPDEKPEQRVWKFDPRHFEGTGRGDHFTPDAFYLSTNYPWRSNLHFFSDADRKERFVIPEFGRYRFTLDIRAVQTQDDHTLGINLGDPRYPTNFRKIRRVFLPRDASTLDIELTLNGGDEVSFTFDSAKIWRVNGNPAEYAGPKLKITGVQVTGPIYDRWPTTAARRILPRSDMSAETLVDHLARILTRRTLPSPDRDALSDLARSRRRSGASDVAVARSLLTALLASPHFIYKSESRELADVELTDVELAERLSFFLWSSVPDATLLEKAQSADLRENLDHEVRRMLADPKAERFVTDFTTQWLQLEKVDDISPDERVFPDVTPLHVAAMADEPRALFRHLLRNDLSLLKLIDADFVMVNDQLADFYGLPPIDGDQFRAIDLPTESQRGGLVAQAAFLKLTSKTFATSPIHRGVWILRNLYGEKLEPPSDLVIEEPDIRGTTTIKEALQRHQQSEACFRCHAKIDPLGFALEYYDPVGRYRELDRQVEVVSKEKVNIHTLPIDAEMTMLDGRSVNDMPSLKRVLMQDRERIIKGVIGKLISYGIGREVTVLDRPFIDDVYDQTAASEQSLRSVIRAIVANPSFAAK